MGTKTLVSSIMTELIRLQINFVTNVLHLTVVLPLQVYYVMNM